MLTAEVVVRARQIAVEHVLWASRGGQREKTAGDLRSFVTEWQRTKLQVCEREGRGPSGGSSAGVRRRAARRRGRKQCTSWTQ